MKLTELLVVTCCSIITARSETAEADQEALLKRASEQLERLAPYRSTASRGESDFAQFRQKLLELSKSPAERNDLDGTRSNADRGVPWEIFEILPERAESDATKRLGDDEKQVTIGIIADPRYDATMQERIKRGFDAGSASLLTGIAGGLISGIASASSSSAAKASSSSSQPIDYKPIDYKPIDYKPTYGAPAYSYEEKPFGPLDFKKAIFGTLFQAIKAIGGGVLALKGQLVKGSGYLLSAKSKFISKTGDAITSFGKQLASSASTHPKPYSSETYAYDHHPPVQNMEHDYNYQGPSASHDDYSEANDFSPHSAYGVPSDDVTFTDNNQGGLLIVAPTKSDPDEHHDQHANVAVEKPDLTKLEESFGGPVKDLAIKDFLNSVPKGSVGQTLDHHQAVSQDNNNHVDAYPPLEHPVPHHDAPDHYSSNHDGPSHGYENYPVDHQLDHHQPDSPLATLSHHLPNLGNHLSVQPSVEYPPLHVQQYEYPAIANAALTSPLLGAPELPHDDGLSVHASLSVDTEPQISQLKLPLAGYPVAFDLPKLEPHVDFHGQQPLAYLHGDLANSLRIRHLNALPAPYWQRQPTLTPLSAFGTLNSFRKRSVLQRRMYANRLAHYASSRATRPRRP